MTEEEKARAFVLAETVGFHRSRERHWRPTVLARALEHRRLADEAESKAITDKQRLDFLEKSLRSSGDGVIEYEDFDDDDEPPCEFRVRAPFRGALAKMGDGETLREAIDDAIAEYGKPHV